MNTTKVVYSRFTNCAKLLKHMNVSIAHRFFCSLLLLTTLPSLGTALEIYRSGSEADSEPEVSFERAYLLSGGGGDVDDACAAFLNHAAGGDVVVLRASGSDGYNDYFYSELGVTLNSVTSLVFQSKADSFSENAVRAIEQAECVFIAGGDQAKYYRYWSGTPVEEALQRHINQGKPLGGTSAGLAVMGDLAYVALHEGSLTSKMALEEPAHPFVTLRKSFLQIPDLKGYITDSHFSKRNRMGRLIVFLAQANSKQQEEDDPWFGLGIDEETALLIDSSGRGRVYSRDKGKVHLVMPLDPPQEIDPGQALNLPTIQVISLGTQSRIHPSTNEVESPKEAYVLSVENGKLSRLGNR